MNLKVRAISTGKAYYDYKTNTIFYNEKYFNTLSDLEKKVIVFHEYAHKYSHTGTLKYRELKADRIAYTNLIKIYPPDDVTRTFLNLVKAPERKEQINKMYNQLKNNSMTNDNLYNVDEIIGTDLYTNTGKTAKAYSLPDTKSAILYTFAGGKLCGTVYSYITTVEGLFWQFYLNDTAYYILHKKGLFNVEILQEQGAETEQQIADDKANADKSTLDKVIDSIKSIVKPIIIIVACYLIYQSFIKKSE